MNNTVPPSDADRNCADSKSDLPARATPQRHPRWHLLGFLLAAFGIATISGSLFLNHGLMGSFATTRLSLSVMLGRLCRSRGAVDGCQHAGQRGVDTNDAPGEVAEQAALLRAFESAIIDARRDLATLGNPEAARPLLPQLDFPSSTRSGWR
jgi:hypothetical protein